MSLLRVVYANFVEGTRVGYFGNVYVKDLTDTCRLRVRCGAEIEGDVTIDGNLDVTDTITTCHLVANCDALINGDLVVNGDITFNAPGTCLTFPDGTQQCTAQVAGPPGPPGPPGPSLFTSYTVTTLTSANSPFTIPALTISAGYYNIYQVDTTAGPITINLPTIAALDNSGQRTHFIVDVGGALTVNPLTVNATGGDVVADSTSVSLEVDYSSLQLSSNLVNRWLII